jgi:hypothetical protein
MAVRTKPIRIFEADHAPVRLLAGVERRSPADVLHSALAEYLHNHRDELQSVYADTQRALAAGDLESLVTAMVGEAADDQMEARMSRRASYRS